MRNNNGQSGFTILEALVAFTILAIFLAILYEALHDGVRRTGLSRVATHATLTLESQLDLLRARQAEPDWDSVTRIPGTRFSIVFIPNGPDESHAGGAGPWTPIRLTAVLTWREAGADRDLKASTVVLAKRRGAR